MSQRNPMNDRYQTDEPHGSTRKSAASAKPKMKAAASVYIPSNSKPAKKGLFSRAKSKSNAPAKKHVPSETERIAQAAYYNPDTPEYRHWRRIWWGSMIAAVVMTGIAFVCMQLFPGQVVMSYVLLGLAYASLFASVGIDLGKVRKIRKAYRDEVLNGKSKEARDARRREKERAREQYDAAKAAEAERAQKKAERKARFGFGHASDKKAAKDEDTSKHSKDSESKTDTKKK
jgi:uncharacterized membrane protein YcjF (UPF0283 family)